MKAADDSEQANDVAGNAPGGQMKAADDSELGEQANDVTGNAPGGRVSGVDRSDESAGRAKTRLTASGLLAVAAAVLAFLATQVSTDLTRQRQATCDGLLPMPTSAYVLGWSGVGAAVLAAIVVLARRPGGGWRIALLVLALAALAFAGFVTYTVYGDAPTTRFMCSG